MTGTINILLINRGGPYGDALNEVMSTDKDKKGNMKAIKYIQLLEVGSISGGNPHNINQTHETSC